MINHNLTEIRKRIEAAALRANRSPAEIKLVAVSKQVPPGIIIEAVENGQLVFGENYLQEAIEKIPQIKNSLPTYGISFHFIGKLQSNKAKKAAELFDVIETVDSIKLARILDKHCATINKHLPAYVQVNIARERNKSGVMAEDCETLLRDIQQLEFLRITGLMTMPPYEPDPESVRPYFKQLARLADKMAEKGLLGRHGEIELSMGMSGDFEVAIEEGATVVRIGTAIFGARPR